MQNVEVEPCAVGIWAHSKRCFPWNIETLTPIPGNLLSAEANDKIQSKIGAEAGRRLDEHTKVLPELMVGDNVQLQNMREDIHWNLNKRVLLPQIMVSVIIQSEFLAVVWLQNAKRKVFPNSTNWSSDIWPGPESSEESWQGRAGWPEYSQSWASYPAG